MRAVVGAPVHLAAGDEVDPGDLLVIAAWVAPWRIAMSALLSVPASTSLSSGSCQRGTLCAPTTMVV